jgi:hypothetical protein
MKIPDEIRKCVVFVCYRTGTKTKLAGTAFLVGIPLEDTGISAVYVITAKHIIDAIRAKSSDQKVYLRMNFKDTEAKLIETPIESWIFHPKESNVDVAIMGWAPPQEIFDYRLIHIQTAATQEVIKQQGIGVGDEVFLTGLFENRVGLQRNLPIIRVGNIASMPEEKIHTRNLGDIDAYLIEARSIGGLSGSPVFVTSSDIDSVKISPKRAAEIYRRFYWLGLMHGHFDLEKLELDALVEDSLTNLKINIGIAIVVPVWKILEVMNQEIFAKGREVAIKQARQKKEGLKSPS